MVEILLVRNQSEADSVYLLAYEFIDWLRARYPEMSSEIDDYLEYQKFEEQILNVLVHYRPPNGECLLAIHNQEPVGILMLKDLGGKVCEMNRMFVRDGARGLGVGRSLLNRLIERSKEMGFEKMVLSALVRHHEALPLYKSSGFQLNAEPFRSGSPESAIHMTLDLTSV